MKKYTIKDFKSKKNYYDFLDYMLNYCDLFSLVYFNYTSDEAYTPSVSCLKSDLSKFKILSKRTNSWPGTYTANEFNHIYELVFYKAEIIVNNILKRTNSIYDWDYPDWPMDLCFYKNGFSVFALSSHEQWNALYTDDDFVVSDLNKIGIHFVYVGEAEEKEIFQLSETDFSNSK